MREILNKTFGNLTVTEILSEYRDSRNILKRVIRCKCACGKDLIVKEAILNFKDASCGCAKIGEGTTHGRSSDRIYKIWADIKTRCYNKKSTHYHHYGGRGIKMCDRWLVSFDCFLEDMRERPSKNHSIERIDVNGDYCPENCKWVTISEQSKNKRKMSNNSSGKSGVSQENIKGNLYRYRAEWRELDGSKRSKSFSINKYGKQEAFRLACEAREEAIKRLNEEGAGYSENHGK